MKISSLKNLITGSVTIKGRTFNKAMLVGISGVVFLHVSLAGIVSVITPWWLGVGDAPRHIDYSWSLYNGEVPRYSAGLQYPVFNELRGDRYGAQNAAKNPPLFYVIHAPVIGPLFDSGHWQAGIAAGRALNILIGVSCILALAWAGWLYGGSRRELLAVAVPAIGITSYDFTVLNQNYALDGLLVLITTLTFVLWHKMIHFGLQKKYLIGLFGLSALGMATKASYLAFFGLSLLTVMIIAVLYGKQKMSKRVLRGIKISALISLGVLLAIGWFYLFNYLMRGEVFKNTDAPTADRPYKSFMTVITHPRLWGMFYQEIAPTPLLSTLMTVTAAFGLLIGFARTKFRELFHNKQRLTLAALLALSVIGTTCIQIAWAVGYGGFYFRYFLPVIFIFSLVLAYGLLEIKRLRGQIITIFITAIAITTLLKVSALSNVTAIVVEAKQASSAVEKIFIETDYNGNSEVIAGALLVFAPIGLMLLAISLFSLTKNKKVRNKNQAIT